MTQPTETFPEALLNVMRRFDEEDLPNIQAAFAAVVQEAAEKDLLVLRWLSDLAVTAKTEGDTKNLSVNNI